MAICAAYYTSGGRTYILEGSGDPSTCAGPVLLSSAEYTNWLAQMAAFGWDAAAFNLAFLGALTLFAIGLGIGLVMSQVRKLRP